MPLRTLCKRLPYLLVPIFLGGMGDLTTATNGVPVTGVEAVALDLVTLVVGADSVLAAAAGLKDATLEEGGDDVIGNRGVLGVGRRGCRDSRGEAEGEGSGEG